MTIRRLFLLAALGLATVAGAWAQATGAPARPPATAASSTLVVKPAASAPVPAKRQTRPMTTNEKHDYVAPPGELKPERPVTPQLSIPLGRKTTDPVTTTRKPAKPAPAPIHDDAVRCAAIADENERAICREAAGLGTSKK